MSTADRRRIRRRILSWVPITVVAVICAGFVVAANVMQDSWWSAPEPTAAADQRSAKGMSVFTGTGIDYLTRDGYMKVELRDASESARSLGLDSDGSRTFEPIVPINAIMLGADGVIDLDLVRSVTVVSEDDRVAAVELLTDNDGAWTAAYAEVADVTSEWGFTPDDLDALRDDLTARSRSADGMPYRAALAEREYHGARVSAEIAVDPAGSQVTARFVVKPL